MIIVVYENWGVDHLTDLLKLMLNIFMLLLLKSLNLLIKFMFLSLSLGVISVASATSNFVALAGPGCVYASTRADNAVTQYKMARGLATLVIADLLILG